MSHSTGGWKIGKSPGFSHCTSSHSVMLKEVMTERMRKPWTAKVGKSDIFLCVTISSLHCPSITHLHCICHPSLQQLLPPISVNTSLLILAVTLGCEWKTECLLKNWVYSWSLFLASCKNTSHALFHLMLLFTSLTEFWLLTLRGVIIPAHHLRLFSLEGPLRFYIISGNHNGYTFIFGKKLFFQV